MNMHSAVSNILRIVAALGFAHSGLTQDSISTETVSVTIFSDRNVSAGREFSDLEVLQAWAKPMRPRAIRLDACESASARHLLAPAHQFRHVYLEMRQLEVGHPMCAAEKTARAVRVGGISQTVTPTERAVDHYWRGLMP